VPIEVPTLKNPTGPKSNEPLAECPVLPGAVRPHGTSSTALGPPQIRFERVERFIHGPALPAIGRGDALLDGLDGFEPLGEVEQPLVRRGILLDATRFDPR
jgi:hypothetical protein